MKCSIYDYETLGQNPNSAPILSIAIYTFNTNTIHSLTIENIVKDCVFASFDVSEQVKNYGKIIEKDTLEWWSKQSKEAQKQIAPSDSDVSIRDLPTLFKAAKVDESDRVFTRGNTFDPIFTSQIFKDINVEEPYKWWTIRDMRSLIEGMTYGSSVKNNFIPPSVNESDLVLHDPRYDIALDVLRIASLT